MIHQEIVGQVIGLGAASLSIVSWLAPTKRNVLKIQCAASLLWVSHYIFLNVIIGAILNISAFFVTLSVHPRLHKQQNIALFFSLFFLGAALYLSFTTHKTLLEINLLPVLAVFIYIIASKLEDIRFRQVSLLERPLWLTYNFYCGSIGGCLTEIFLLMSALVGLYLSIHRKQRNELKTPVLSIGSTDEPPQQTPF